MPYARSPLAQHRGVDSNDGHRWKTTPGIDRIVRSDQCPGVAVRRAASTQLRSDPMPDQADSALIRLAIADLRLAAWFLWMTPLLAALSS